MFLVCMLRGIYKKSALFPLKNTQQFRFWPERTWESTARVTATDRTAAVPMEPGLHSVTAGENCFLCVGFIRTLDINTDLHTGEHW